MHGGYPLWLVNADGAIQKERFWPDFAPNGTPPSTSARIGPAQSCNNGRCWSRVVAGWGRWLGALTGGAGWGRWPAAVFCYLSGSNPLRFLPERPRGGPCSPHISTRGSRSQSNLIDGVGLCRAGAPGGALVVISGTYLMGWDGSCCKIPARGQGRKKARAGGSPPIGDLSPTRSGWAWVGAPVGASGTRSDG